jgi:hypothetical protein
VTPVGGNASRSTFVIVGLAMAVLLFFAALAVPSRAFRWTTVGRALVHQQTNLVLAGIATLALTAIAFALTAP